MLIFIINPSSGNESGFKKWKALERFLIKSKIEYKSYLTDAKGDAKELSYKISKIYQESGECLRLVAVGGDGTVNEVVEGLNLCDNITLGYIPTGTGNDLARALHFPKSPLQCLKRILKPKAIKDMDYGIVFYGNGQHRRFIVSCGIGFDAMIVKEKEERLRNLTVRQDKRNPLLYIALGIHQLLTLTTSKALVIIDMIRKVELNHLVFLSAHIHSSEGGGFRFSPKADDTDGELSICIVHQKKLWKLIRILLSARSGNHLKYPGVRNYESNNLVVQTAVPLALHVDGEYLGMYQDVEMTCLKGKIRFIV